MKTPLQKQNILLKHLLALALTGMASLVTSQGVTIDMVTIGNPGNAAQSASNRDHGYSGGDGYGAVDYVYQIGKTEVNLAQYTEFLNKVDPSGSNALGLYNSDMGTNSDIKGIAFDSGAASGSKYSVIGSGLRPVTYVSFYDAARFVNWLHNGQGAGGTEYGAYTISSGGITSASRTGNTVTITLGAASTLSVGDQVTVSGVSDGVFNGTWIVTGVSGSTFTYNTSGSGTASGTGGEHLGASATHTAEAEFWIPSEDEWYKAAYYDPTKNGGTGGYWLYATQSDTLAGNTIGVADSANYYDGNFARDQNGLPTYLTDGGAYGENSESYYGTSDQAGNVWERNEALVGSSSRGQRGGSWRLDGDYLRSSHRNSNTPTSENGFVGFRIASVPEPSTGVLMILGGAALLAGRRRMF